MVRFKLAEFRTSRGMTQSELSDELNVTQATISHLESGRMKFSDKYMRIFSEKYGKEALEPFIEDGTDTNDVDFHQESIIGNYTNTVNHAPSNQSSSHLLERMSERVFEMSATIERLAQENAQLKVELAKYQ